MSSSKNDSIYISNLTGGFISGMVLLVLKIFMMYNLWQDVFVANNIVASFKSIILFILFGSNNMTPISLAIFKYLGVPIGFTISSTTLWLVLGCIITEAFFNEFYKAYKSMKDKKGV